MLEYPGNFLTFDAFWLLNNWRWPKKVQKNSVPETYTYIGYPQVNDYIYVIHRSRITLQIRIFVDFC